MAVEFRYPTSADIDYLSANMDEADRIELLAQGMDPAYATRLSVEDSKDCVAITEPNGTLACITGIVVPDDLSNVGYPWLLGTPAMQIYPKKILQLSRTIFDIWASEYSYMTNFVDTRHTRAIRWLRWLGAEMELIEAHGPFNNPFYKFSFGGKE